MMRCILIALVVALGVAGGITWRKVALTKEANARLGAENEDLKQRLTVVTEEQNQKREAESKRASIEAQELAKLRGEVSRLRVATNEAGKLRSEVSALKLRLSETKNQKPGDVTPTPSVAAADQFPRQSWAFSGYTTPETALVSTIWAMKEGKPQVFMDSLSPEEQQRMAQTWQGKSEEEIAAKHQNDVENIQGVRILSRTAISPTEIQMQVFLEGANRMETFKMNQAGDQQWKFGGLIRK